MTFFAKWLSGYPRIIGMSKEKPVRTDRFCFEIKPPVVFLIDKRIDTFFGPTPAKCRIPIPDGIKIRTDWENPTVIQMIQPLGRSDGKITKPTQMPPSITEVNSFPIKNGRI